MPETLIKSTRIWALSLAAVLAWPAMAQDESQTPTVTPAAAVEDRSVDGTGRQLPVAYQPACQRPAPPPVATWTDSSGVSESVDDSGDSRSVDGTGGDARSVDGTGDDAHSVDGTGRQLPECAPDTDRSVDGTGDDERSVDGTGGEARSVDGTNHEN